MSFLPVHTFEKHDNKLRYNEFERNFELIHLKYDSLQAEYVSTANAHLYSQMKYYIDSAQRIEIIALGDSVCIYRQFYMNREIATGRLKVNRAKFDTYTEHFFDENRDDSITIEKRYHLHREGEWMDAELIGGIYVEENQHFLNGLRHGEFKKVIFWHINLEISEYKENELIAHSILYKTDFNDTLLFGLWDINFVSTYCESCPNKGDSFTMLSREDNEIGLI